MEVGKVGDRVVMESERVGRPPRKGEILEVLGAGEEIHYRVRWEDGHESTFIPTAGSTTIVHKAHKAGLSKGRIPSLGLPPGGSFPPPGSSMRRGR